MSQSEVALAGISSPELPTYLYHYMPMAAMLGALETRSLWASEIQSVNDFSEILHTYGVLEEVIESKFHRLRVRDNEWFHGIARQLRSIKPRFGVCVASLCEEHDQLSLWRAYASDGQGASLGLLAKPLRELVSQSGLRLEKVIYNRRDQVAICNPFVNALFKKFGIEGKVAELPKEAIEDIMTFATLIGPLFKNSGFSDEREWRIFSNPIHLYDAGWKYRAKVNMIAPYIEIDLSKLYSSDPELMGDEVRPPLSIGLGPRVRQSSPTAAALQARMNAILGRGYGVSKSGVTYHE